MAPAVAQPDRDADVDLVTGTLRVQRSIAELKTETWEKDPKTHQHRRIALDPESVTLLTAHGARSMELAAALGYELAHDAFVFSLSGDGAARMNPRTITRRYGRLVQRLCCRTATRCCSPSRSRRWTCCPAAGSGAAGPRLAARGVRGTRHPRQSADPRPRRAVPRPARHLDDRRRGGHVDHCRRVGPAQEGECGAAAAQCTAEVDVDRGGPGRVVEETTFEQVFIDRSPARRGSLDEPVPRRRCRVRGGRWRVRRRAGGRWRGASASRAGSGAWVWRRWPWTSAP